MKKSVSIIIFAVFIFLIPSVFAAQTDDKSLYEEQYFASGIGNLEDALPNDVKQELNEFDISDMQLEWKEKLEPLNVFSKIFDIFKNGFKSPLIAGCTIIAIILFGACVGGVTSDDKVIKYVLSIGIVAAAVLPCVSIIGTCVSAVKSLSVFMSSFIPIYAGILIAEGRTVTATGFSGVMLFVTEAVSMIISFIVVPLSGMQLALCVCGSVSSEINISSFAKAIKRVAVWILSLCSTVLLGILGLQSAVSVPADNMAVKTTRFIIGTAVPIVGNTVSEAMSTVRGCLKLLGSSAAVYAVIAVALIYLPIIAELFIWRVVLLVCAAVADMISTENIAGLIRNVDSVISFVLGVMILIAIVFIIALTMVTALR